MLSLRYSSRPVSSAANRPGAKTQGPGSRRWRLAAASSVLALSMVSAAGIWWQQPSTAWAGTQRGASLVGASAVKTSSQKEKDRLERERKAAAQKHEALKSQVEGVDAALGQAYLDLKATQTQIPIAQTELQKAQVKLQGAQHNHTLLVERLSTARAQSHDLDGQISKGEKKLAQTQVAVGQIARQVYRGEQLDSSWWNLLFEAQSSDDLARRAQWAHTATQTQNKLIDEAAEATAQARNLRHRQEALTVRIGELEVQAAAAVKAADEAKNERSQKLTEINALKAQQEQLSKNLENQKSTIEAQIRENEAFQAATQSRIAQIDAEMRAAAAAAAARARAGQGPGADGPRTINGSGIFSRPLASINVTSSFGTRTHPILKSQIFHAGTDMGADCGTPIYAVQSGTVKSAAWDGTGGNSIYLTHGTINGSTWITVYRHLSKFGVSAGQSVSKGQQIGLVGTTGRSTGCHLHFEVYKNGSLIDPMSVL